jgi:hypothetical protein
MTTEQAGGVPVDVWGGRGRGEVKGHEPSPCYYATRNSLLLRVAEPRPGETLVARTGWICSALLVDLCLGNNLRADDGAERDCERFMSI